MLQFIHYSLRTFKGRFLAVLTIGWLGSMTADIAVHYGVVTHPGFSRFVVVSVLDVPWHIHMILSTTGLVLIVCAWYLYGQQVHHTANDELYRLSH